MRYRAVQDDTGQCKMIEESAVGCRAVQDDKGQSVQDDAGKYSIIQDSAG